MSDHFQDCTAHAARRTIAVRRGFTLIETLVVASVTAIAMMVAVPALQQSRQQASHVVCKNRLKHIGLAMHNYHDVYNSFPPGWVSRRQAGEGHPSTGWCASILPYLEQARLYNELNMYGSVYEPLRQNAQSKTRTNELLKRPLEVFRCAVEPKEGVNPLRGGWGMSNFSGNYGSQPIPRWSDLDFLPGQVPSPTLVRRGAAQGVPPNGFFSVNSNVRIRDTTDGTSNTIMVGERSIIGRGGLWPGPRSNFHESDVVSDGSYASALNRSDTGFSSRHAQIVHFCFADGAVRAISSDIESKPEGGLFQHLCSRNGGEVVGEF